MNQFRLPRKVKKTLKGKLWLYPADEKGNSLMAFPRRSQEDYTALKKGVVRNLIDPKNAKARRKAYWEKLDKAVIVSDEELRRYVDDIFRDEFRNRSFNVLINAKKHPKAIKAYYNFVNAYHFYQIDGSHGNTCCMAVDWAEDLLKGK